jgi:hypothetical protein
MGLGNELGYEASGTPFRKRRNGNLVRLCVRGWLDDKLYKKRLVREACCNSALGTRSGFESR